MDEDRIKRIARAMCRAAGLDAVPPGGGAVCRPSPRCRGKALRKPQAVARLQAKVAMTRPGTPIRRPGLFCRQQLLSRCRNESLCIFVERLVIPDGAKRRSGIHVEPRPDALRHGSRVKPGMTPGFRTKPARSRAS